MAALRSTDRPLLALSALGALGLVAAYPASARAATIPRVVPALSCPAGMVCDTALGIAFARPAGWVQDQAPVGILEYSGRPTAGATHNVVRLSIVSWGTTSDRDDARVAAAGMDSLLGGVRPTSRITVTYAGAPGVQATGVPSNGPVTAIILAHAGVAYKILAPDQFAALRSLRFIPRVGPFPPANGTGVPSAPPAVDPCASPTPPGQPISGPVTRRVTVLSGGPNRFELIEGLPAGATAFAPYGLLTFVTGSTAYVAPGHVFERGTTRRACIAGPVAVLRARGDQPYGGPLRIVPARIDGDFIGTTGRVTLTVGRATYYVYGTASTRTTTSAR